MTRPPLGWAALSPHRGGRYALPESSTLGRGLALRSRLPLGQAPAHPQGGHEQYPAVAPDRGGITVSQSSRSHQPPRQVNGGVSRFVLARFPVRCDVVYPALMAHIAGFFA